MGDTKHMTTNTTKNPIQLKTGDVLVGSLFDLVVQTVESSGFGAVKITGHRADDPGTVLTYTVDAGRPVTIR